MMCMLEVESGTVLGLVLSITSEPRSVHVVLGLENDSMVRVGSVT